MELVHNWAFAAVVGRGLGNPSMERLGALVAGIAKQLSIVRNRYRTAFLGNYDDERVGFF